MNTTSGREPRSRADSVTAQLRAYAARADTGLAAGLAEGALSHDMHVQAAVWLLLTHDVWPRRDEFAAVCRRSPDAQESWIDWTAARAALDAGGFARSSSTERAVLDLAIDLGCDRYRFSAMGAPTAGMVLHAVGHALGGAR
jgi:hypothetical protein